MSSTDNATPPSATQADADAAGANRPADKRKKKRIRNWTADDRAAHRVFERSRREAFKERLITLASLIPSLKATDTNRLSKHVVVDESVALHKAEQEKIIQLVAERNELIDELNSWRERAGLAPRQKRSLSDVTGGADTLKTANEAALGDGGMVEIPLDLHRGDGEQTFINEQTAFVVPNPPAVDTAMMPPGRPNLSNSAHDIPWNPPGISFGMPMSLDIGSDFQDMALHKSADYTHLPLNYGIPQPEQNVEPSRYTSGTSQTLDSMTFQGNSFLYNG